jgi:hypothetical protein
MRVENGSEVALRHVMMRHGSVEPIWGGRVGRPGMRRADMIWHSIEHKFHASRVHGIDQALEIVHRAEMRIGPVHIRGAVAVVCAAAAAVVVRRRDPDAGNAKLLQIVEVIFYAFEVTAMPAAGEGALGHGIGARGCAGSVKPVVGEVAVGKPVGHDEVQRILRGKTLEACALRLALL